MKNTDNMRVGRMEELEPSCEGIEWLLWDIVWHFYTMLNRDWPHDSDAEVDTQEKQKHMFTQNLYVNIHCSIIYKSQKEEITPMTTNK